MKNILFVTGLSQKFGTGHWRRSLLLGDYLRDKGFGIYFFRLPKGRVYLPEMRRDVLSYEQCLSKRLDALIYDFPYEDKRLLRKFSFLKKRGCVFIALDFFNDSSRSVDVAINLFNQNASWNPRRNMKAHYHESLDYVILQDHFLKKRRPAYPNAKRTRCVFIAFGGADPSRLTQKVVEALLKDPGVSEYEFHIVLGSLSRDRERLRQLIGKRNNFRVYHDVEDPSALMRRADLAIAGGATTVLELLYLMKPVCMLPQNDREKAFCDYLLKKRLVSSMSLRDSFNVASLATLTKRRVRPENIRQAVTGAGKRKIEVILRHAIRNA